MLKAIIIGSTGATGKHLLRKMVSNKNFSQVTSIGRRAAMDGEKNTKLVDVVIDSLMDLSSTEKYWENNDVFFNCIGTTRKRAGSVKEFINIEKGISNEAAKMAAKANIPHASLISAKGADHKRWAKNWIHPLLYMKTIGQKEQTILSNFSFKKVSIFKPEMLIRLQDKRSWAETIFESKLFGGLRVDILASAMMQDAEREGSEKRENLSQFFIGNKEIRSSLEL